MVNRDVPQVERWSYEQLASFLSWCQGMQANCPSNSETGRQRIAVIVNMLELMRIEANRGVTSVGRILVKSCCWPRKGMSSSRGDVFTYPVLVLLSRVARDLGIGSCIPRALARCGLVWGGVAINKSPWQRGAAER